MWKAGYEIKFFIWQQALTPFVRIGASIIDILLLPTPYLTRWDTKWLEFIIRKQMKKRIKELTINQPTTNT